MPHRVESVGTMAQKKIAFKCVPGSATISERDSRQSIFVVLSGLTQSDTKADQDVIQSLFLIGIRLYERCRCRNAIRFAINASARKQS